MKINSILINNKDNVVTSLELIEKCSNVVYKNENQTLSIKAIDSVPSYHKIATKDISKGEYIYKYGEIIGAAIIDIKIGQHVSHLNIDSLPRDYHKESFEIKGE